MIVLGVQERSASTLVDGISTVFVWVGSKEVIGDGLRVLQDLLLPGQLMVNVEPAEVPPPGDGLNTVT